MTILNFKIKKFSFDWGWYSGNIFAILDLQILQKVDWGIVLLNIQIFKFTIYICIDGE